MAWDVADIPDQTGRRALVTGATNGIGLEAAAGLAARGAEVILTGRDPGRGEAALATIRRRHPAANIRFVLADAARLEAIRALAAAIDADGRPLDILLNNAGLVAPNRRGTTADGFELQFGVNFLAPYVLTALLIPALRRAPAARVVTIASVAHRRARIDFDDLQSTRGYNRMRAYAQSKLADLMFAIELDRRLRAAGSSITSLAAHPGLALTNIFQGAEIPFAGLLKATVLPLFTHGSAPGALPGLYAATAPDAVPGGYYGPTGAGERRGPVGRAEVRPQARDPQTAARLFATAEALTGVAFPTDLAALAPPPAAAIPSRT
jgi:NAD(P)-dependent dehydrogenase (short-subunit alcohol dehydrogenase family)